MKSIFFIIFLSFLLEGCKEKDKNCFLRIDIGTGKQETVCE